MYWHEIETPIGRLLIAGDEKGLRKVSFQDGPRPFSPPAAWTRAAAPFAEVAAQLEDYFAGRRRRFELVELVLAPEGTPFQRDVWSLLQTIPYGQVVSYGELARRLGKPNASRAVGAANGQNPLPIIIPCHRVTGSDGSPTGFGGGLPIKRRLLDLEAGEQRTLGW